MHDGPAPLPGKDSVAQYAHGLTGVDLKLDRALSNGMWAFIAFVLFVVLGLRLWQLFYERIRLIFAVNLPEKTEYWSTDKTRWWPWLKKNILYAPLNNKRHNKEIMLSRAVNMGTLPSRLHAGILVTYMLCNMIYMLYLNYHNPQAAVLAELRGRSGHLAMVNMLPLVILAGRNNPLINLLRVSFDTYNLFHRWLGRLVVIQALVHTACWAANNNNAHGPRGTSMALHRSAFNRWGMAGTAAMGLLLIQSPSPIRHAFYETFLHCHQLLALAAIIATIAHCNIGELPSSHYIYLTLTAWVLDRLVRFFRLAYHNWGRRSGTTKITVEAIPGAKTGGLEATRLTVSLIRPWKFTPGTHAYIYIPSMSLWMNHPFSIAWSSERQDPNLRPFSQWSLPSFNDKDLEYQLQNSYRSSIRRPGSPSSLDTSHPTAGVAPGMDFGPYNPNGKATDLHFIIARRTGMTAALYDAAVASPTGTITLTGFLEGPYGGNDNLSSYHTAILFAGGVGITHQIGHVKHLLDGHTSSTVATRKIVLVWSVKDTECLEWIRPYMDEILAMPNRRDVLKVLLFVTKPKNKREVKSPSSRVIMVPGRCRPRELLEMELREREGAAVVTVCGVGAFADEVRDAVRGVTGVEGFGGNGAVVDFVEEAFSW